MRFFTLSFTLLFFTFLANFSIGQNFKTEVRMLDSSNASIKAGLYITQVDKNKFEQLIIKIKNQNLFILEDEFFVEKNSGKIYLKSNNKLTLKDFELFLKQLEIYSVVYKNQTISSQEIVSNYKHYNKDEIKKIGRIK